MVAPTKKSKRQREVEELEAQLEECEKERERLIAEREALKGYETVGMIVYNSKYGEGIVTTVDDSYVIVDFLDFERKFNKTKAFTQGNLVSEYTGYKDYIEQYSNLKERIEELDKKIKDIKSQLDKLRIW